MMIKNKYGKYTYEFIKSKIEERGYHLMSEEYINNHTKLKLMCPEGHDWSVVWANFRNGQSCPICSRRRMGDRYKTKFSKIKNCFEKDGYRLLSNEDVYKEAHSKLDVVCPEGHGWSVSWHNFRKGTRCGYCYHKAKGISERTPVRVIKRRLEKEGYKLLSEYVGANSPISIECPNGHVWNTRWAHFCHSGSRCPFCQGVAKKSQEEVEETVASFGYKLKSVYKSTHKKILLICPSGHCWNVCFHEFMKGDRCPKCRIFNISRVSQEWLDFLGIDTEHREKVIEISNRRYKADAFCEKDNTIYEFFGDFWHGNPEVFNLNAVNNVNKKTFRQLYQKTMDRIRIFEEAGYNVVYIWEKDFVAFMKENKA